MIQGQVILNSILVKNIIYLGKTHEIDIKDNYIRAGTLEKIVDDNGSLIRSYDPGYMNTINCVYIF